MYHHSFESSSPPRFVSLHSLLAVTFIFLAVNSNANRAFPCVQGAHVSPPFENAYILCIELLLPDVVSKCNGLVQQAIHT